MATLEFESGALGVAPGSDCRGSARIPWGGMGLYGTAGALEVIEVDMATRLRRPGRGRQSRYANGARAAANGAASRCVGTPSPVPC